MSKNTLDILLLIARPAAGKSEVIDYLKRTPLIDREKRFHIREFEEFDDFPILWTWFEEDKILEDLGYPRLHSDDDRYFKWNYLWDVLIHHLCLNYSKRFRDDPTYHERYTAIFEFARGSQHGGFKRAFEHLSKEVVERLVIMYINVSWEESLRKNKSRFNPDRPDSILEHGLSDEKLEELYKESDWDEVSAEDPKFIITQGIKVPYVVFENEDDVTTGRGEALGKRLEKTLRKLWRIYADS